MTCTNSVLDKLEAEKDRLQENVPGKSCSPSAVSKKKLAKYKCSEIRDRLVALNKLLAKRQEIQNKCFGGNPDPAHAGAIQDLKQGIKACENLELINCTPGHPMANL